MQISINYITLTVQGIVVSFIIFMIALRLAKSTSLSSGTSCIGGFRVGLAEPRELRFEELLAAELRDRLPDVLECKDTTPLTGDFGIVLAEPCELEAKLRDRDASIL
jgi:hypothetical protein